ncbi:MAG: hypothetical protein H6Q67_1287 [Firmicutes bacterium]|nr:hypothetical protein [Bacillota bacterium]
MEKKNNFFTFLAALVPGLGYMYLGLIKKGVQTLALFLLIKHVFPFIGLGFIAYFIVIPFWFYTFFDTFTVARKINQGELVEDCDFFFENHNTENTIKTLGEKKFFSILAWVLIVVGVLAIANKLFAQCDYYYIFFSYASSYFFPILLIGGGIYLLLKEKRRSDGQ